MPTSVRKERQGHLITGILPKGHGAAVIEALYERGTVRFNLSNARGSDIEDAHEETKGFKVEEEKEILTVLAKDKEEADELFWFIFDVAEIDRPGGGFLYMTVLSASVPFMLPEL